MANPMDPVLSHHTSQERLSAAVPELLNNKLHQSPKQSHAEDHTKQIEATSGEDHRRRTGRLQIRKECHRAADEGQQHQYLLTAVEKEDGAPSGRNTMDVHSMSKSTM